MAFVQDTLIIEGSIATNNLDANAMASRADQNVLGREALVYRAAVAGVGNTDVTLQQAVRVLAVWCVKTGGAGAGGDTITVSNGASAITNAMVTNVADTTVVRATSVDRTNANIAAGGTLRYTGAGAATNAAIVYVLAARNSGA